MEYDVKLINKEDDAFDAIRKILFATPKEHLENIKQSLYQQAMADLTKGVPVQIVLVKLLKAMDKYGDWCIHFHANETYNNYAEFKVIQNKEKKTTVLCFPDGFKTKVKCGPEDAFNEEAGVALAFMKYMIGTETNKDFQKFMQDKLSKASITKKEVGKIEKKIAEKNEQINQKTRKTTKKTVKKASNEEK